MMMLLFLGAECESRQKLFSPFFCAIPGENCGEVDVCGMARWKLTDFFKVCAMYSGDDAI